MATPHVISVLSKKYAKLLGEHEFAERMTEDAIGLDAITEATNRCDARKMEIDKKLATIETMIWLFNPDWNPATIRPNYPRKRYDNRATDLCWTRCVLKNVRKSANLYV